MQRLRKLFGWRKATKAELRFKLVNAETANKRLTAELDEAQQLAAGFAADCVRLEDDKRRLEASLSGVREELRQEQKSRAIAEQDAADKAVTVEGLGFAMRDLEKAAAERRVILLGQRADLHDVDQEKRYHDGLGDQ